MADKFGFGKKIEKLRQMKYDLPRSLALSGQTFFQLNFDRQQWEGVPWAKRKKETKKTLGKAILVRTGKLRQAMQKTVRSYDWKKVVWGVDRSVFYATYLNSGTNKMPKREFLGYNKKMNDLMKKKITLAYKKVMEK